MCLSFDHKLDPFATRLDHHVVVFDTRLCSAGEVDWSEEHVAGGVLTTHF
jgi:hypothetical protein